MEIARVNKLNDTVPRMLMWISAPGMFIKQFVNVVQLVEACQKLAEGDRKAREIARELKGR